MLGASPVPPSYDPYVDPGQPSAESKPTHSPMSPDPPCSHAALVGHAHRTAHDHAHVRADLQQPQVHHEHLRLWRPFPGPLLWIHGPRLQRQAEVSSLPVAGGVDLACTWLSLRALASHNSPGKGGAKGRTPLSPAGFLRPRAEVPVRTKFDASALPCPTQDRHAFGRVRGGLSM